MSDVGKPLRTLPAIEQVLERLDERSRIHDQKAQKAARWSSNTKTRFLNFRFGRAVILDDLSDENALGRATTRRNSYPAVLARLTIVSGPGFGTTFGLNKQVTQIGRDLRQDVCLDFGDDSGSRRCHASITWYGGRTFAVRDAMKPNPVLLNGATLTGEAALEDGDLIQLGETVLRFEVG